MLKKSILSLKFEILVKLVCNNKISSEVKLNVHFSISSKL
jgi:hypothetical protein